MGQGFAVSTMVPWDIMSEKQISPQYMYISYIHFFQTNFEAPAGDKNIGFKILNQLSIPEWISGFT